MPQLVKGGKHVFGWSRVGNTGRIVIPPDALAEYRLKESEKLILLPGSRTSGGFGLGTRDSVRNSPLGQAINLHPDLKKLQAPEGAAVEYKGKTYCWAELRNGAIAVPARALAKYGIGAGDRLLVIRGSGLALGFAVRGPIVEEAGKHPELEVFAPDTR